MYRYQFWNIPFQDPFEVWLDTMDNIVAYLIFYYSL